MNKQLKILIVRLSAIGDVIHCIPVLHALRRKFPNAYMSWIVEDKAADILINNPLLDQVYVLPKKKWKKQGLTTATCKEFFEFIKSIRKEKFDIAIDLQELFKSGILTFLSNAKIRIAHAKTREFAEIFVNKKLKAHNIFDPDKMIIERYLEPAEYLGAPIDEVKFTLPPVSQEIKSHIDNLFENIDKNKPVIIFSPATIWNTKHWIESYWSKLLDKLSLNNNIIFTGAKQDIDLINRIILMADTNNYLSLAGKIGLLELVEVFNRADIVIAPDTGPAHIANATNKPVIITIFGSTSHKRSCPYGEKHTAISAKLSCQPCFKRKCPRKDFPMECMEKITPEMVLKIVEQKLKNLVHPPPYPSLEGGELG
ncbi:MAG: glycosyltransferase family 9 protein [bacterium]